MKLLYLSMQSDLCRDHSPCNPSNHGSRACDCTSSQPRYTSRSGALQGGECASSNHTTDTRLNSSSYASRHDTAGRETDSGQERGGSDSGSGGTDYSTDNKTSDTRYIK